MKSRAQGSRVCTKYTIDCPSHGKPWFVLYLAYGQKLEKQKHCVEMDKTVNK